MRFPKIVHAISVLPPPGKHIIGQLKQMISSYLWKNGNAKVSAHQLAQKIENGGFKMTHIGTYLQTVTLNWVKRFSISKHGWQNLFYTILNIKNNKPVWELDAKSLNLLAKNIQNPF